MILATVANLMVTGFGLTKKAGGKLEYRTEDFVPNRLEQPEEKPVVDKRQELADKIKAAFLEMSK